MKTGLFFFKIHWFKASALHRKLGVYMGSLMPLALLLLQIQAQSSRNLTTRECYQLGHCPHIMYHILDLVYMVVFFLHFFYGYGFNWVCVQICPKMVGSCFFFFFYLIKKKIWLCHTACVLLIPRPENESVPPVLKACSLNLCSDSGVPEMALTHSPWHPL